MRRPDPFALGRARIISDGHRVPHITFVVDDVAWTLSLLDERGGSDRATGLAYSDPTLLLFRGDEEVPVVTMHLDPDANCVDEDHVIVPEQPREP